ncbi:MAG: DNA-directed DNA polymerase I [Thaumarchaeota archaeon]|nr:DNA-directed DNA polymerase I [Nitrososphaerota archaeon]
MNENTQNYNNKENLLLLVSATYDGKKKTAILKFYDVKIQKIILWEDRTNHKPYCYSKLDLSNLDFLKDRDDLIKIEKVQKTDLLMDKKIYVSKIIVKDPLAIGGTQFNKSIRNIIKTWESDIKYYENYLYDNSLNIGKFYKIKDNTITPHEFNESNEIVAILKNLLVEKHTYDGIINNSQFKNKILNWAKLLDQPIPKIKRLSFDIEVESEIGRIPDVKTALKKITAIGFFGSDGFKQISLLTESNKRIKINQMPKNVDVNYFDNEKDLILDAFKIIESYPFIITFNGDNFDVPYLTKRAENLNIENNRSPFIALRDSSTLKNGIHIDLYRTFSNRSYQIYAFNNKYTDFSLDSISKALLNKSKLYQNFNINDLELSQLARYCFNDAELTYELTSFNDDLLMNLFIVIARIAKMPIDDISRIGVSQWIRNILYYEHRQINAIIPRRDELEKRSANVLSNAINKDKKFRGGLVVDPIEGIHFNVVVMDFASLYPSIIKIKNLSYETVRCVHEECKLNKITETNHWACTKKNGLTSSIIGSLRDLRVNYYKHLAKVVSQKQQLYLTISQALKVILNASYGVMGAEIFPLYFLPAAEATTAIGRYTILETIKKCKENSINVLYGDTDSLFLKNPNNEQIKFVIDSAKKEHNVDLEIDKIYRYVALSNRKKNYFGVTKDGKVDVKGLTGKKSHTPRFIKTLFQELLKILSQIKSINDFENAKIQISSKISECAKLVLSKKISLNELAFNVMISKSTSEYVKTIPQHIRAAKLLETVREVKKGDIISYVKIISKPGVKPVEMARNEEIDSNKYMEFMESTLDQIISSMNLDFDTMLGKPKQTGLDQFFWS